MTVDNIIVYIYVYIYKRNSVVRENRIKEVHNDCHLIICLKFDESLFTCKSIV